MESALRLKMVGNGFAISTIRYMSYDLNQVRRMVRRLVIG